MEYGDSIEKKLKAYKLMKAKYEIEEKPLINDEVFSKSTVPEIIDALKEENTLDITTKAGSLSVTLKLTDKKSGNKKGCKNSLEIISWVSLSLISFSPIIIALKKKEEGYKNV